MNLDLVILVLLATACIVGILRGFLRQLVSLVAFLVGFAVAWILPDPLAGLLVRSAGQSRAVLSAVFGLVFFIIAYFIVRRVMKRLLEEKEETFQGSAGDRLLGGLLMAVKCAVVVLVVVWLLDFIMGDRLDLNPGADRTWNDSRLVRTSRIYNPLTGLTSVRRCKGFFVAIQDAEARRLLEGQPVYMRMVSNPNYKAVKDDEALKVNLEKGRLKKVSRNANLRALIEDQGFWNDAAAVRWEEALLLPDVRRESGKGAAREIGARSPGPPPAPPPTHVPRSTPTPVPTKAPSTATPSRLSKIYLRNGSVIEGKLLSNTPQGIVLEVSMEGGTISMSVSRGEISRIEGPR